MTNQDAEAGAARDALTSGEDRDGDRTAGRLATAAALAVIAAFVAGAMAAMAASNPSALAPRASTSGA